MSTYEYWIGQGVDFVGVWNNYESGLDYIDKYRTMRVHLIRFTFEQPPSNWPLFNHEAIYKTIKGYFHELKRLCFTEDEYAVAGPLFLYEIDRGSGIWSFLGEFRPLYLLAVTLVQEKIVGQRLENLEKMLEINNKYFGGAANINDFQQFMNATTPPDVQLGIRKLFDQRLQKIEISQESFTDSVPRQLTMVDIKSPLPASQSSEVNIYVTHGDVNIGGDVTGRDKYEKG
jgi:hypothetical protein